MAYPDRVLARGEEVVEHLHPHWITLVPAALWFLICCAGVGVVVGYAPDGKPWHLVVIVAVIVMALALFVSRSLRPWVARASTHYVFTSRRVLIRRGVLRRRGHDIALSRISDVGFSQSLWDRIVRAGTVTIESAGEYGREVLADIPRSEEQQQLLNRLIERDAERRTGGSRGYRGEYGYSAPDYSSHGYSAPDHSSQDYSSQDYSSEDSGTDYYPTERFPPQD